MKKTLVIVATLAMAVGAFAQGKVTFGNGPTHLVTIDTRAAYAGSEVPGTAASQIGVGNAVMGSLTAQLYGGTAANSLSLQATFTPAGFAGFADGRFLNSAVTLTGIGSSVSAFFQILVWDTSAGSYATASAPSTVGKWYGSSPVFTATTGSFAPNPLDASTGWPAGPIVLSANPVPEPSTFALAGLGAASLLLFRRRK